MALGGGRMHDLVGCHEPEDFDGIVLVSRANQSAALARISRSRRNCLFSLRIRFRSSCSWRECRSLRRPPSRSAWRTQVRIACAASSNSWPAPQMWKDAYQLGITATPTVFLNGWRYPVPPTDVELSRAISAIVNGAPPFPN